MKSLKNGSWWDATCWEGNRAPSPIDDIILEHEMTSDRSIIIENKLYCRKGGIEFIKVDNKKFVGGGHSPYEIPKGGTEPLHVTDVGLWVTKDGQLDLRGKQKTGWVKLSQGFKTGDTTFSATASRWEVGDRLAISPTALDAFTFSEVTIKSINGNEYTIDPLPRDHPANTNPRSRNTFYPEVLNITRSEVYIKGTKGGESHVLINSTKPQFIEHVFFQHMGVRKEQVGNDDRSEFVLGRYPVHFHHAGDGSRGSKITGNVCIDCPSHCYVPHGSNGIYFFDNISYRTMETPYWVDLGHSSTDITYDHNFAGDARFIVRSKNMGAGDGIALGDLPPTLAVNGFQLSKGKKLTAINNCAAGIATGDAKAGGAFFWEANDEDEEWLFENNIAHNCYCLLGVWQNTRTHHLIKRFVGYNAIAYKNDEGQTERMGIRNGAYGNPYRYMNCEIFNAVVHAKAASLVYDNSPDGYGQIWDNCIFDEFIMIASPLPSEVPLLMRNSKVGKIVDHAGVEQSGSALMPHNLDVVNTTFESISFGPNAGATETIRVQNGSDIYKLTKAGKTPIAKFNFDAPAQFGNAEISKVFVRNNCGAFENGSPVTYVVPKDKYKANTQSEADALAQKDIDDNGQSFANANGVCVPIPNTAPTAIAGADITITLPLDTVTLNGTGTDPEGSQLSFVWNQVSGPTPVTIPSIGRDLTVSNLKEGTYKFRLTVTDDRGATGIDDVDVIVKPAPVVPPPTKPVTAKFNSQVTIENAKAGSKYQLTAYSKNTVYQSGVLTAGTNVIDTTPITQDTLYVRVDGVLVQKIVK